MKTNFDFRNCRWAGNAEARVSRHDLVMKAPPFDPVRYGLALGNGTLGVMTWCEKDKLMMVMNRCDLWDDVELDDFRNWNRPEEEKSTTLRHGCRLIFDFGEPVFDEFYLNSFEARLSIADGLLTVRAETPFGAVDFEAFVVYDCDSEDVGVLCCKLKADFAEEHGVKLTMERYGSRTFSHWYRYKVLDTTIGLENTQSGEQNKQMFITHELPIGTFACGAKAESEDFVPERETCHKVSGMLSCGKENVIYAGITPPMKEGARETISRSLDNYAKVGYSALYLESKEKWSGFWEASYIATEDDFWDNIWALTMFYDNCSQRGKMIARFIDGLWATKRDFQAWNFIFHWNQQQIYWPLNASGHPELCDGYLNYRFNSLPKAIRSAKVHQNVDNGGAYVSDVCDRRGNNSLAELENHTPVAEIALDFYRQYRFTCDVNFLKEKALPYMLAASRYIQTLFAKEEDGLYHAVEGTGYEGWIMMHDTTTELGCGHALIKATLAALKDADEHVPEEELWEDMAEHMAPFLTNKVSEKSAVKGENGYTISGGALKGEPCDDTVVVSGYNKELGLDTSARLISGIFPTADRSPVFPCGDFGLKDKGTEMFEIMANTTRVYGEACMGWDPASIMTARMGLGDDTARIVDNHIEKWLYFQNGFGFYGTGEDYNNRFDTRTICSLRNGEPVTENIRCDSWEFRHIGLECTGVLSCVRSETLLQSHDGTIRLFPAVKKNYSAKFTLHAYDGFEVSAEMENGIVLWAAIKSNYGKTLRMENPWGKTFFMRDWEGKISELNSSVIEVPTNVGDVLVFTEDGKFDFETEEIPVCRNENAKIHSSGRMLGREIFS